MTNWGFDDSDGNSITRGWQGDRDQAEAYAQDLADSRQETVSFYDESRPRRPPTVVEPS